MQRLQESLLLLELGRPPLLILDDVVVVRPEERSFACDPLDESREIQIGAAAGFL